MNSKHSHCTTITKTPAVAQTALQVKLEFVTELTDVMFGMATALLTSALATVTEFANNVGTVKQS